MICKQLHEFGEKDRNVKRKSTAFYCKQWNPHKCTC
jgi:hypothetical protein